MKKPKPYFKERKGWAVDKSGLGGGWIACRKRLSSATHRVTVQDARRPSALRAVEKVLQVRYNGIPEGLKKVQGDRLCSHTEAAGMTAKITNGKVTCKWRDK